MWANIYPPPPSQSLVNNASLTWQTHNKDISNLQPVKHKGNLLQIQEPLDFPFIPKYFNRSNYRYPAYFFLLSLQCCCLCFKTTKLWRKKQKLLLNFMGILLFHLQILDIRSIDWFLFSRCFTARKHTFISLLHQKCRRLHESKWNNCSLTPANSYHFRRLYSHADSRTPILSIYETHLLNVCFHILPPSSSEQLFKGKNSHVTNGRFECTGNECMHHVHVFITCMKSSKLRNPINK